MKRSRTGGADESAAKQAAFAQGLSKLNAAFAAWVREQGGRGLSLAAGVQDYRDYVSSLRGKYLRGEGQVLTFGSGDCGQLAHGIDEDEDLMVKYPRKVLSLADKQVVGISCGGLHNAVYTSTGAVYTWGCNDDGSLGRVGAEQDAIRVTGGGLENEIIVGVACGDGQTLCLTVKGVVYGWGCYKDKEGKKFFNPSPDDAKAKIKKQQDTPIVIAGLPASSPVTEICCGSSHNLALCGDGSVYSWGLGESGELGRDAGEMKLPAEGDEEQEYDMKNILAKHITPLPMLVGAGSSSSSGGAGAGAGSPLKAGRAIGAGAYHSLVVTASGVYSTGLNNYGQLGHGDTDNRCQLAEIAALRGLGVRVVKGGIHHSLCLTTGGEVLGFGRGDSGQVGIMALSSKGGGEAGAFVWLPVLVPFPGPGPVTISEISAGANHNLALAASGALYSWGYGDMLALGHGLEEDEPAPRKVDYAKVKTLGGALGSDFEVGLVSGGGQHSAFIAAQLRR